MDINIREIISETIKNIKKENNDNESFDFIGDGLIECNKQN